MSLGRHGYSALFAQLAFVAVLMGLGQAQRVDASALVQIHDAVVVVYGHGYEEARVLDVYAAGPDKRSHVIGTIRMNNQHYALHELVAHGNYVFAQFWTELEIYDLSDPTRPRLARLVNLKPNHPSWAGGCIVFDGEAVTILGTTVSAELLMKGPPADWQVRPIPPTPQLERRMEVLYYERHEERNRLADPNDLYGGTPRTIFLPGGVFAVEWTAKYSPGLIRHRQYLRLVGSRARVLIGTSEETID